MGASAPHPHGQVSDAISRTRRTAEVKPGLVTILVRLDRFSMGAAQDLTPYSVPDEPAATLANLARYAASTPTAPSNHPTGPGGRPCLLCSYAAEEISRKERMVEVDESGWVAVVPFWAVWPFEILGTLDPLLTFVKDWFLRRWWTSPTVQEAYPIHPGNDTR